MESTELTPSKTRHDLTTAEAAKVAPLPRRKECGKTWCDCLPSCVFEPLACFGGGTILWVAILGTTFGVAAGVFDAVGSSSVQATNTTAANTTATTDDECGFPLSDLSEHFIKKGSFNALSCDDQEEVVGFMDTFLDAMRVEAVFLTECGVILNYMLLMQG